MVRDVGPGSTVQDVRLSLSSPWSDRGQLERERFERRPYRDVCSLWMSKSEEVDAFTPVREVGWERELCGSRSEL